MKRDEVSNSLKAAIFSTDTDKLINGIAGSVFQKNIEALADEILTNLSSKRFKTVHNPESLESLNGKRVRLHGDIAYFETETCYVPVAKEGKVHNRAISYSRMKIQIGTNLVECVPVLNKSLGERIAKHRQKRVIVTGTIIRVPISSRRTRAMIFVDQISESTSLVDFFHPKAEMVDKANKFIDKYKEGLFDELIRRLIRRFKIVEDDSSRITATFLPQLALLIAASQPYLGIKCGKIHALILGDPGGGKGFLLEMLKLLLVHFREVQGGTISGPGFTARTILNAESGAVTTKKGALALAHEGAVYLQDVHSIKNKPFAEISHTLSDQMEFGKVVISTSANTSHLAATSVVVDMNFKSKVDKKKTYSAYDDIRWENQMLSRFDVIAVIETLTKDTKAIEALAGAHLNGDAAYSKEDDDLMFKTVIAIIHDRIKTVDTSAVTSMVSSRISDFYESNEVDTRASIEFDSSFNRLPKAITKIIIAHARLHLRAVANSDDVEFAMKLIRLKFNVLRRLEPSITTKALRASFISAAELRRDWIGRFMGTESFRIEEVTKAYNSIHQDSPVDEQTVRRDLRLIATPMGKGRWRLRSIDKNVKSVKIDKNDKTDNAN